MNFIASKYTRWNDHNAAFECADKVNRMLLALEIIAWLVLFVFAFRGARWAYAVFVLLALVWIPARTGFHLHPPPCRMQFTLELAVGSLMKYKHVFLFTAFFVMTWVQCRRS